MKIEYGLMNFYVHFFFSWGLTVDQYSLVPSIHCLGCVIRSICVSYPAVWFYHQLVVFHRLELFRLPSAVTLCVSSALCIDDFTAL